MIKSYSREWLKSIALFVASIRRVKKNGGWVSMPLPLVTFVSPCSCRETIGKGVPQIVIQNLYPSLQQQVCTLTCPPHLLFLYKTLADHLVHGRFNKRSGNRLAMPVTIAVVWDKSLVGHYIAVKFFYCLYHFLFVRRIFFQHLQIIVQVINSLQGVQDIAVPEIPIDTFQVFFHIGPAGAFEQKGTVSRILTSSSTYLSE